jgi:hypothetical protein
VSAFAGERQGARYGRRAPIGKEIGEIMSECKWYHKYGDWSKPFQSEQQRETGSFGSIRTYPVVVQQRICNMCGHVDARIVYDGTLPKEVNHERPLE